MDSNRIFFSANINYKEDDIPPKREYNRMNSDLREQQW